MNLTLDGLDYWKVTHHDIVERVKIKDTKKKEVKPKEITIKCKNGQTKRVVI